MTERVRVSPIPTLVSMIQGDRIDARAMAAIAVKQERDYRIHGINDTPADRVRRWGDSTLRETIEQRNGEPLL